MEKESIDLNSQEKLMERVGSAYKLVILAARRALELSNGAARLVEASSKEKPLIVALREIAEGKVSIKTSKKKSKESLKEES